MAVLLGYESVWHRLQAGGNAGTRSSASGPQAAEVHLIAQSLSTIVGRLFHFFLPCRPGQAGVPAVHSAGRVSQSLLTPPGLPDRLSPCCAMPDRMTPQLFWELFMRSLGFRISVLILALASQVSAEEAVLPDGQRIAGELKLIDGRLRLVGKTQSLSLDQIHQVHCRANPVQLHTGGIHRVILRSGQSVTGELLSVDADAVRLRP